MEGWERIDLGISCNAVRTRGLEWRTTRVRVGAIASAAEQEQLEQGDIWASHTIDHKTTHSNADTDSVYVESVRQAHDA